MNKKIYEAMMTDAAGKSTGTPRDFMGHSRYSLQLFADGESGGDGPGEPGEGEPSGTAGDGKGEPAAGGSGSGTPGKRTYDVAEVDRIIAENRKEWEKQHAEDLEKAKDEARRYERMSKEQRAEADRVASEKKAEEESAKKDARIAELEERIAMDALRKSVAADVEAMPESIAASQDFLDLVVTGNADTSNANVKKLVGIILADRKAQEEKRAAGRTPKSYNNGGAVSEIDKRIAKYQ